MKRKPAIYILIGILIGALFTGFMAHKAISSISAGEDYLFTDPQKLNPAEAFKNYDNAKKYWPLYNQSSVVTEIRSKLSNSPKSSKDLTVTVFFKQTVTNKEVSDFTIQIKAVSGVKNVKLISKQDAMNKYKEQNKNEPLTLDLVTVDAFPTSLDINIDISDKNLLSAIQGQAKSKSYVESVIVTNDIK